MGDTPTRILRLDTSMRQQGSVGRALMDRLTNHLTSAMPTCEYARRDLKSGLGHTSSAWRTASLTDPESRSAEDRAVLAQSEALVAELDRADILVIAMPVYNFSVPTSFRAWIDLVCRDNVDGGCASDTTARPRDKHAIVVLTSNYTLAGGTDDFVTGYVDFILKFIGARDVQIINATGLGNDRYAVIAAAEASIDTAAARIVKSSLSTAAE